MKFIFIGVQTLHCTKTEDLTALFDVSTCLAVLSFLEWKYNYKYISLEVSVEYFSEIF